MMYDIRPHPKDTKPSWVIRPIKTGYSPCGKIELNTETSEQFEAQRIIDLRETTAGTLHPTNIEAVLKNQIKKELKAGSYRDYGYKSKKL